MSKSEKNRAQRRLERKRNTVRRPSFWTTTQGKVVAGVIGAAILAFVVYGFWPKSSSTAPAQKAASPTPAKPPATHVPQPTAPATPPPDPSAKLETKDVKVGTGAEAKPGDTVTVHYTGTLTDGSKFDSSVDKNQPFTFKLGSGMVIKGWEEGVAGMKVGGKRQLVVPPHLGYGGNPRPGIPANSTLKFDVELLKVESAGAK